MQIREQGKKIQCIRSAYDPEIKRSRQSVVLTFSRWATRLPPDDELAELTDSERQELVTWFEQREAVQADSDRKLTLSCLVRNIERLTAAVSAAEDGELSEGQAADAWAELARLQKALKAAGFPRPKQVKAAAQVKGQGELL